MKSVHLVITDLFLPKDFASGIYTDLHLPVLEKMLACGAPVKPFILIPSTSSGDVQHSGAEGPAQTGEGGSLENFLCELFGVQCKPDAPIAPVSAAFEGLGEGCWLRADPVHLRLQRDQLVLLPEVKIGADEAGKMCASLNLHFAGQGMEFFAPHPQRWYIRLDRLPDIETVPLSQAVGRNVHGLLPKGAEAMRWHQIFNEIQMLLFAHSVNEAREASGELPINSLWFWGGGCNTLLIKQLAIRLGEQTTLAKPLVMAKSADSGCSSAKLSHKLYDGVSSDDLLARMFASVADIPFVEWSEQWGCQESSGGQLLVWNGLRQALQRGDLSAWRDALQGFETGYAQPLWRALCSGRITQLRVYIIGRDGVRQVLLNRASAWAFWRRTKPLDQYV